MPSEISTVFCLIVCELLLHPMWCKLPFAWCMVWDMYRTWHGDANTLLLYLFLSHWAMFAGWKWGNSVMFPHMSKPRTCHGVTAQVDTDVLLPEVEFACKSAVHDKRGRHRLSWTAAASSGGPCCRRRCPGSLWLRWCYVWDHWGCWTQHS